MKRFLFGFLAALFLILNTIPYLHILADDMPTSSQYEMLGAYALSTLITSGEATELDFSDYTESDTSFLIDLGEAIFTGDWSGLAEDGLEWLGETADSAYDSYKEYISQWKSDHLGIMYSNWFPDEQIYVGPDDSYSLARPLRDLLTPRGENSPIPDPDPDYNIYLQIINTIQTVEGNYDCDYLTGKGVFSTYSYYKPVGVVKPVGVSFYCRNYNNLNFRSAPTNCQITCCANVLDININSNLLSFSVANYTPYFIGIYLEGRENNEAYNADTFFAQSYNSSDNAYGCNQFYRIGNMPNNQTGGFANLEAIFIYLSQRFKHVNIYVDGVPWSIVGNSSPSYPIVIPGQLTIWNNQPLQYSFPSDTHIDLPDLTNIIRNAINSSGVVMWSDIADVFVDVNGQTAIAVTKIVRNDYDNLYMEQYPYPAMLVGMTEQTRFNEHLLDDSHSYLSPMGTIVQETVNVLPSELVGVLAIGAILTIFAVIINRLLE